MRITAATVSVVAREYVPSRASRVLGLAVACSVATVCAYLVGECKSSLCGGRSARGSRSLYGSVDAALTMAVFGGWSRATVLSGTGKMMSSWMSVGSEWFARGCAEGFGRTLVEP